MPPPSPTKKSGNLSLAELISHDDVLTDVLVDNVYYWTTIRKNRPRYMPARSIKEEQIAEIVRKHLIHNPDLKSAMQQLENLPSINNYKGRLKPTELDHFRKHLEKYASIYLPDCPFEVTTTNRYTIFSHEASITARKYIKSGEKINYLTGHRVELTAEQEIELENSERNFSIVASSLRKTLSIFLGPARFANHDCNANSRLIPNGHYGMEVHSKRPISVDEEITVSYGDDYFGINNCDCLCASCEKVQRNGWNKAAADESQCSSALPTPITDLAESIEVTDLGYKLRSIKPSSKKRFFDSTDVSRDNTPELSLKRRRTATPRVGTKSQESPKFSPDAQEPDLQNKKISQPNSRLQPIDPSEESDYTSSSNKPLSSESPTIIKSEGSISSLEEDELLLVDINKNKINIEAQSIDTVILDRKNDNFTISNTTDSLITASAINDFDSQEPVNVPRTTNIITTTTSTTITTTTTTTTPDTNKSDHRIPGDYNTHRGLLSAPSSAWITCETCDRRWIQQNAYEPRIACPRCERHSKLYGFNWPKTVREGPHDKEERVFDHREIARTAGKRKAWDTSEIWEAREKDGGKAWSGIYKGWSTSNELEKLKKRSRKSSSAPPKGKTAKGAKSTGSKGHKK